MLVDDVTEQKNTEEVSKRLLEEKIRISTIFKTIESERERFARELHDGLGQLLTTAKLKLDIIKLKTDKSILEINDTVNLLINAGDEIRRIISDLKPSDVENFGLASSIELLIERIRQASGINIILAILTTKEFKNKTTEIIIYRVIQEALNNIVKHSRCTNALIELSTTDSELQLNIIDDGVGVDLSKLNANVKSYGIHNIQERVSSLNGKVEIESKPEKGFKFHITIPI
jgi:signal transduction histidine kinase